MRDILTKFRIDMNCTAEKAKLLRVIVQQVDGLGRGGGGVVVLVGSNRRGSYPTYIVGSCPVTRKVQLLYCQSSSTMLVCSAHSLIIQIIVMDYSLT